MLEKEYEVGKEVEMVDLRDGELKIATVIRHLSAGFKRFAGIFVKFDDDHIQEVDREFL